MVVTVTLTPALDKTVTLPGFTIGKVNRVETLRLDAGGKGINVSKVLKSLGTGSLATGILGGGTGKFIQSSLEEAGIACDFVFIPQDTRTNLKIIDPVHHTNTDINEPGAPVSAETLEAVYAKAEAALAPGDIVVLAGKAPQGTDEGIFAEWTRRFQRKGAQVYLDADGALLTRGVEACPSLIKPNDEELSRLMGTQLSHLSDVARAACALVRRGVETVVVSLGGEGALFAREGQVLRARGLKVPVQSTVGAGDSMMAALCHGAQKGLSFRDACALSVAVSAAAVMTPGTQAAEPRDVQALLPKVELEEINV